MEVSNEYVTNGYIQDSDDASITILTIFSNSADYIRHIIIDSQFVPELRNFVWTAGIPGNSKYLTAAVTNANRQHLQRLNLFRGQKRISIHQFIPSLNCGEWVTNVILLSGNTYDVRISSLAWDSDVTRKRLDHEYDEIVGRNQAHL